VSLTTGINITRTRGDSYPVRFTIQSNGAALNITSYSFTFTVDPEQAPSSAANNLFALTGVITSAAGGAFEFRPTTANTNLTPATYYYDVQMTDTTPYVTTIARGKFIIEQDVTK